MWERSFLQSNNPDSLVQPSSCHNFSERGVALSCVIFTVLHGTGQVHSPVHAALGVQHTTGPHMTFRVRARVRVRRRFVTMVRIKAPDPIYVPGRDKSPYRCVC